MSCYYRLLSEVLADSHVSSEANGGTTFVGSGGASWRFKIFSLVHCTVQVRFQLSWLCDQNAILNLLILNNRSAQSRLGLEWFGFEVIDLNEKFHVDTNISNCHVYSIIRTWRSCFRNFWGFSGQCGGPSPPIWGSNVTWSWSTNFIIFRATVYHQFLKWKGSLDNKALICEGGPVLWY